MTEPTLSAENKIRIDGLETAIAKGFETSNANDQKIIEGQDKLTKALFYDNGGDCMQSKINSNTACNKTIIGFLSALGIVVLGIVGKLLLAYFTAK